MHFMLISRSLSCTLSTGVFQINQIYLSTPLLILNIAIPYLTTYPTIS